MFGFKIESKPLKLLKLYEVIYEKEVVREPCSSVVYGRDEFEAIDNFRAIGSRHRYANIVSIKPYKMEGV